MRPRTRAKIREISPIFIDFEASSLNEASYPIEVAWGSHNDNIECHLISPAAIMNWTDWNQESEQIHGLSRPFLIEHGEHPSDVCHAVRQALEGKTIYSDAPSYDGFWLERLFSGCHVPPPRINIAHIDTILHEQLRRASNDDQIPSWRTRELKYEARRRVAGQHRASWDVEYLIKLWQLTNL